MQDALHQLISASSDLASRAASSRQYYCRCRLLHRENVRVCHVPDVALATTGAYNSTVQALSAKASRQVGIHSQVWI